MTGVTSAREINVSAAEAERELQRLRRKFPRGSELPACRFSGAGLTCWTCGWNVVHGFLPWEVDTAQTLGGEE